MYEMTADWLSIWMADEFHDWIDGDDPVSEYKRYKSEDGYCVWVKFESGAEFNITIQQTHE